MDPPGKGIKSFCRKYYRRFFLFLGFACIFLAIGGTSGPRGVEDPSVNYLFGLGLGSLLPAIAAYILNIK
jgi:hypothetical protein